ncbi:MAG: RNA 3'-terminal phosphate cyclase [Armatimonadota bacterium]
MKPFISIDGSYGEGGGQIIRTALSLAAITGTPVEISNVRLGRQKPGLQPQHLMAVQAAAAICGAEVTGAAVGSMRLTFTPGATPQPGSYRFDIGTAGATTLVVQTVLLPLALAGMPSRVTVTGGTHVPHAPGCEYLEGIYLPTLCRAGLHARLSCARFGFYPRGGGEISAQIDPSSLQPVDLTERGKLRSLRAYIITSGLPAHVGERGGAAVETFMKGIGRPVTIEQRDLPSNGPGAAVILAAQCEGGHAGFTAMGERGKPMERVAEEACEDFLRWWKSGAAVDEHLADQLVLPTALAGGESRWTTPTLTDHLHTVLWTTQHFLPIEWTISELGEQEYEIAVKSNRQESFLMAY